MNGCLRRLLPGILLLAGLTACTDMHDQPSFKPQEAPRRTAPPEAVPHEGRQVVTWQSQVSNPIAANEASILRGADLYQVNCAMCHGTRETYLGKIGKLFQPPPPSLHDPRITALSDGDLFKRISLGFGRMPAFQNRLSATDRWHLVNYVGTFLPEDQR